MLRNAAMVAVFAGLAGSWGASAQQAYPEGAEIPRHLTPEEAAFVRDNPIRADLRGSTPPPTGPVVCPGEYEPMDGILVAWEGTTGWLNILTQMAVRITSPTGGNARLYVAVDTTTEQSSVASTLAGAGVDMSRVVFVVRTTDTIWIRDYGPRYIYEGDVRAIVDHTYNRPRPNDDAFSVFFAQSRGHQFYEMPLVHGGGNYHLDTTGRGYATRLITNENPGLTEQQILDLWSDYQNVATNLFTPFPASVDLTQHIDMWMQVVSADRVVISDWPYNVGSTQDVICDQAAAFMQGLGFQVFRVPARSLSGVHYTYTNVVMVNGIVLVPSYTNTGMTAAPSVPPGGPSVNLNAAALSSWQQALAGTGKTPEQINCEAIVSAAGVMHCIVMHVPAHRGAPGPGGGLAPTAYLRSPNGGEVFAPGSTQSVRWSTDDDNAVTGVDLLFSADGGSTWSTLASSPPNTGSFNWTVPAVTTSQARVRVVARDAQSNTGADASDLNFRVAGACSGDTNGDNVVNFADLNTVLSQFGQTPPGGGFLAGDANGDGIVNFADLNTVLSGFGGSC